MITLSLLQKMFWNAEQKVLGLRYIIDICTSVHLILLEVKSVWQRAYLNLHAEESCWFSLSGYICYYENTLKFSTEREITFSK